MHFIDSGECDFTYGLAHSHLCSILQPNSYAFQSAHAFSEPFSRHPYSSVTRHRHKFYHCHKGEHQNAQRPLWFCFNDFPLLI